MDFLSLIIIKYLDGNDGKHLQELQALIGLNTSPPVVPTPVYPSPLAPILAAAGPSSSRVAQPSITTLNMAVLSDMKYPMNKPEEENWIFFCIREH